MVMMRDERVSFKGLGLFMYYNGFLVHSYDEMRIELNELESTFREFYRLGYIFKDFNDVQYDLEGLLKRCQYLYKYS